MKNGIQKIKTWQFVEQQVLAGWDLNQPAVKWGVSRWKSQVKRLRQEIGDGDAEILYRFGTSELLSASVSYGKALIQVFILQYLMAEAEQKRKKVFAEVEEALLKAGILKGDEYEISPSALVVVKSTGERGRILKIVDYCRTSAAGEKTNPPLELPEDFLRDWNEFLKQNGIKGKQLVEKLCAKNSPALVKEIFDGQEFPKPVRWLAGEILLLSQNKLPEEASGDNAPIGFTPPGEAEKSNSK